MNQKTFSVKRNSSKEDIFHYKPTVVGCFSLDSNRTYSNDLSQLKYIVRFPERDEVNVKYDLDAGRDSAITVVDEKHDVIDNILRWITETFRQEDWVPPDFVCMRGMLNHILGTPYENQRGWIVCAMRWKGTIYLCEKETEEMRRSINNRTDRDRQMLSWGYKFEQYMCSDEPDGIPNTTLPVNEPEGLRVIFRAELNSHRLLFGAEMDGVRGKRKIKNCADLACAEFVELKTNRKIMNPWQDKNFRRFKIFKWWGQCYLTGVRHIVGGFRDDRGVVHTLRHYRTADIPGMAEEWNHRACMSFCNRFLDFVKSLVTDEDLDVIWRFKWKPEEENVTAEKILGPSELAFLPRWFTSVYRPKQQHDNVV